MDFKQLEISNNKQVYLLKSNNETLKMFPFEFELYITYIIEENKLTVEYKVINIGKETMIFGIGGHLGIKIDPKMKYYFELEKEENDIEFMEVEGIFISNNPAPNLLENKRIIRIKEDSFINDAIMIRKYKSKEITLYEGNDFKQKKIVKFNFGDFPVLALWSIPKAPYICIEPWFDFADKVVETGYFKDKEGIISLEKSKTFKCKYSMEF